MSPEFPSEGLSCSSYWPGNIQRAWGSWPSPGSLARGGAGEHQISPHPVLLSEVSPFSVLLGNTWMPPALPARPRPWAGDHPGRHGQWWPAAVP